MIRRSLVAMLCALAALIGACSAGATPPAAATAPPPPILAETRYVNAEGRFRLALPEGWSAAGPFAIPVDGGGTYNLYTLGLEPSAEGGPGISRVIVADAADLTVDQFLTLQCSIRPQHPVEAVTPGSVSAQATRIGGGSVPFEVEWYFVEHAGKLIGLSIIDPETMETLIPVVQSLRLE